MDIRTLRLFLAVYDSGNITVAAERLQMNQPAVSKAVRRLEEELGVALFEREARGVAPTLFAEMLAEAGREVDGALSAVMRQIRAVSDAQEGQIRIGAGGTWQEMLLPAAVSALSRRLPRARFQIVPAAPEALISALIRGELDLVLAPIAVPEAAADKVKAEPLIENELVVVGRAGHPLSDRDNLTMEDLSRQGWVLPGGSLIRQRFTDAFESKGFEPPLPTIECVDNDCLFQILQSTDLLTYVAELRLRHRAHMNLCRMPVNPLESDRASGLILRKSSYLPPLARELIAEVRRTVAAEGAGAARIS